MTRIADAVGSEHAGDADVVCEVCGRGFESPEALDRHVHDAGLLY